MRLKPRQAEQLVAVWNRMYDVGTVVDVTLHDGRVVRTTTRSEAKQLDEVTPVVWLEMVPEGFYLLTQVKPVACAPTGGPSTVALVRRQG